MDHPLLQLVELLAPLATDCSTLDELAHMIENPRSWPKARALFHRIREKTLAAEAARNKTLETQYLFEEVCAKTLYNLTNGPAPFDADTPYWIIPNAIHAARQLGLKDEQVLAIVLRP